MCVRKLHLWLCIISTLIVAAPAFATIFATVKGLVHDPQHRAVPGAVAKIHADPKDALADIEAADAAYGTVPPELFVRAKKLRWICASRAGTACESSLIGQARCASRAEQARGWCRPAFDK